MHGCSPRPLCLYCSCILFSLWDCTIHDCGGRNEEWRTEKRLKVARGVREERGWAFDWNVKPKQKQRQPNTSHTDGNNNKTSNGPITELVHSEEHCIAQLTQSENDYTVDSLSISSYTYKLQIPGGGKIDYTSHCSAAASLNKYALKVQYSMLPEQVV